MSGPTVSPDQDEKFQAMLATMMSKLIPTKRLDDGNDRKFELGAKFHVRVWNDGRQLQWECGYIQPLKGPCEKLAFDSQLMEKNVRASPREWQLMFNRIPPTTRTPALTKFLEDINIRVLTMEEKLAEQGIVEVS